MDILYAQPTTDAISIQHAAKIHRLMFQLVLEQRPGSVLEVGCGAGVVGAMIAVRGIRYVGIDPDDRSLSTAKSQFPDLRVIKGSCYDDPATSTLGEFDVVCSTDVIEHVYDPRTYLQFVAAHLRANGSFVCGTPNYGNYTRNLLLSIFNRWDHHHNPLWDGGHIKFFSKRTLGQLFDECGFQIDQWHSMASTRVPLISAALFCVARLRNTDPA